MRHKGPAKQHRIGEAAKALELNTSVLRFWEDEFSQLRPKRTPKGQRLYSEKDMDLLRRIRSLLHEQGMTIDGARRVLSGKQEAPAEVSTNASADASADAPAGAQVDAPAYSSAFVAVPVAAQAGLPAKQQYSLVQTPGSVAHSATAPVFLERQADLLRELTRDLAELREQLRAPAASLMGPAGDASPQDFDRPDE